MFVAAYGLVAAVYEKTLGEIFEDPELSHKVISIMVEIDNIAKKLNTPLDPDIVNISFSKASLFPYETKTSFQRDLELKGNVNEGDLFGGTLIRFGKTLKIPTPYTIDIYQKLIEKYHLVNGI